MRTEPRWWEGMNPLDSLAHIANALYSLLHGVEDEETLEECRVAAEVWMVDLRAILGANNDR